MNKIEQTLINLLKSINWDWDKYPTLPISVEACICKFTKEDVEEFINAVYKRTG